jgi:ribose/xylose/arabinose/galactoside ABC-type transport system permease subunit
MAIVIIAGGIDLSVGAIYVRRRFRISMNG